MSTVMDSEMELPSSHVNGARVVEGSWRVCGCRAWRLLDRLERDAELGWVMAWAWQRYLVRLKLLAHGEHVGVHELASVARGHGNARQVMDKLCRWADCSQVMMELTPTNEFGADLAWLTRFYVSLGFVPNTEPQRPFRWRGEMIRRPVHGRRHRLL